MQLFYANEAPELQTRTRLNQRIEMLRSPDGGATWTAPITITAAPDRRDGMPAPLVLAGGRGIVCAIESALKAGPAPAGALLKAAS